MIETIVGVFIGVLLASTLGSIISYFTVRALILRDKRVQELLKLLKKEVSEYATA